MFFWDVKLTPSRPMKLHDVPTKVVKVDLQDVSDISSNGGTMGHFF